MTQTSDQKNWDAALIKIWRTNGCLLDVMSLFTSLSGKLANECDPPLKRLPPKGFPWQVGVKVFVAEHLSKISKRLWEQSPDKDIALLRKLELSTYDTEKDTIKNREYDNARSQYRRNRLKVGMSTLAVSNRNNDTNWKVVK